MTNRLINRFENYAPDTFEDMLLLYATNIEDALLQAGAKPGQDYTILDCFRLGQPFVLKLMDEGKLTIATGWSGH